MRSLIFATILVLASGCAAEAEDGAANGDALGAAAAALTLDESANGEKLIVVKDTSYVLSLRSEPGFEWTVVLAEPGRTAPYREQAPRTARSAQRQQFAWRAKLLPDRSAQKHTLEYRRTGSSTVLRRFEFSVITVGAGRGSPACPTVSRPVCGSDGLWYENTCEAANAGVDVPGGGCTTDDFRCPPVDAIDCERLGTTGYCRDDYREWARATCGTAYHD